MKPWYVGAATIVAVFFIYMWHIDSQARVELEHRQWCNGMYGWSDDTCVEMRVADCVSHNNRVFPDYIAQRMCRARERRK